MNEYEYFSPEIIIEIGSYTIKKDITAEIRIDLEKAADWAVIKFSDKLLNAVLVSKYDTVKIYIGYNNQYESIFSGFVMSVQNNEITAKNKFIRLSEIMLTKSFVKCTPQEIIKFILNIAEIESFELNSEPYPIKNLISIRNMNCIEILKYIEIKWRIKDCIYYFDFETFKWNIPKIQTEYFKFEYGENILELQNICPEEWELTTISVPQIKLLDKIVVNHPKLSADMTVTAINFYVNEFGFIRTKLTIKE